MIHLTDHHQIGPVLRQLRCEAGLTIRQAAERAQVSRSGISKREHSAAGYLGLLIEHAHALGFAVALVPARHPGARPTGTGWPT